MKKSIIKIFILVCSLFLLSFKTNLCSQFFEVESSTYSNWTGGVKDVKGKTYEISLKLKELNKVEFTGLLINGTRHDFQKHEQIRNLTLKSIVTERMNKPRMNLDDSKERNPENKVITEDEIYLEYRILKTNKIKTYRIKNIKFKPRLRNSGEALVQ